MHTRTHSETHRTKLIIPRISYIYLRSAYSRQCSGLARAPTPPRQKPSDWLTRVTPARSNNISASLVRNVFVLTRCFPERLKNANLSFRKQLKNDLKATRAGQTWSGVEKKRHQYYSMFIQHLLGMITIRVLDSLYYG